MFEQASEISQTNKIFSFGFSERLVRKRPDLSFGLVKRSGCPEQWSKLSQKYDLIRRFRPFLGHLERFGENWIPIWIKWQRLQVLVWLTFSSSSYFLKKSKKNFEVWSEKIFLWNRCFDIQTIQNPVILGFENAFKKSKFQSKFVQFTNLVGIIKMPTFGFYSTSDFDTL